MEFTPVTEKHCFSCGTTKPVAAFSQHNIRKDGLQTQCKACVSAYRAARHAADPDRERARSASHRESHPERERASQAAYRGKNRERRRAGGAAWYLANTERKLASNAAWYLANTERHLANSAAWAAANPDRKQVSHAARRARELQAIPGWADQAPLQTIYAKAKEWSAILGIELHVDHVIPLKSKLACGLHTAENLQLLAADINIRKGNRTWPDMPGDGLY